jgi:oligopeptide/dipeptide ABC transporter ATP-binding protein
MYAGQEVENGPVIDVFSRPLMPYTAGLIRSVPTLTGSPGSERLYTIPGQGPKTGMVSNGCAFAPRCDLVQESCRNQKVAMEVAGNRSFRCLRAKELAAS